MNHLNITLIVLALLGVIDAVYLGWKYVKKEELICPLDGECNKVVNSKWSKFLGIRNELWGVVYYVFVLIFGILLALGRVESFVVYLAVLSGIGLAFSVFLVYVQAKIIKTYCFYCLISALLSFLIFLNALALFLS